jgi:putative membrane protein
MIEHHAVTSDDLARQRTLMAADRTLMAWIRTTLSMISFGFTIYKFLQAVHESTDKTGIREPSGARNLGLTLISLGVVSLAIACLQYWQTARQLNVGPVKRRFNLSLGVAGFVALVGVVALMNVLFRIGPF